MDECVQETDVGTSVALISFEADGSQLLTSLGAITIHELPLVGQATANEASAAQVVTELTKGHRFGYGFSPDRCWITWHGHNLLWLLFEFRPGKSAVSGCTVVIGRNSGRVIFIRFNTEAINSCLSFS